MRSIPAPLPLAAVRTPEARRAVGGRCAPVTARGRAVLEASRQRVQPARPRLAQAQYEGWITS
jgi:hypothetical protein